MSLFSKLGLSSSSKERPAARNKSRFFSPELSHPDSPSNSSQRQSSISTGSSRNTQTLGRSASAKQSKNSERRASLHTVIPESDGSQQQQPGPTTSTTSNNTFSSGSLSRSHTIRESGARRDGSGTTRNTVIGISSPVENTAPYLTGVGSTNSIEASPSHAHDFSNLPTPQEQPEYYSSAFSADPDRPANAKPLDSMSAASKTSQDSGSQPAALDRWSQRRLQRLNTEQGFREQRQGGHAALISSSSNAASVSSGSSEQPSGFNPGAQYANSSDAAQPPHQPHPLGQSAFQTSRTAQPNAGHTIPTSSISNPSRLQQFPSSDSPSHVQQHSPTISAGYTTQDSTRPTLNQTRSFGKPGSIDSSSSMSNNNASLPAGKAARAGNGNRQSVHNGMASRDGSHSTQGGQVPPLNPAGQAAVAQGQAYKGAGGQQAQQPQSDAGRGGTPQPPQAADEMTKEEVEQMQKEFKELREKYTKVKKYYFEKEDQVKQLQNSLAHQRLSQSRTSLDDTEYTSRFNRLDGLIAQLAYSIRKSWKSIPQWLSGSVNRDAVALGRHEMTAVGRAAISCWLVEEVFDKYFHPDLELSLSMQLKSIQRNIRKNAPMAQTAEEEENLTSKVVNWRLATLEGLHDTLRSPSCSDNRQKLTDLLQESLVASLAVYLQDPPPSDLQGGVSMIIELVVSIAIHVPLESRDVVIEYFMPGYSLMNEQMKVEPTSATNGVPPLTTSINDDLAEQASMKSTTSDVTDMTDNSNADPATKKRSMLSAFTGSKSSKAQGKHPGASGSSSSLQRPESAHGKEEGPPRVRMAASIGVAVRGRSVLQKAIVFST